MKRLSALLLVCAAFICSFLLGCSTPHSNSSSKIEETEEGNSAHLLPTALSRKAAAARSKQISHVAYVMWFGIDGEHEDFEGRTVINFDLKPKAREHGSSLGIDFESAIISSVTLNGTVLPANGPEGNRYSDHYDNHRITFKLNDLQPGANRVEIAYRHSFSKNGDGLYRFKDPADGKIYLYTNFEPYAAHLVFPCFDQPDLKASYELTVEAPETWQVIANTMERDVATVDGRKSWAFPPTPLLSTYLFAMHAGPYKMWKADADGIPMRLFIRQSLAPYLDKDEWFDITRKGLEYYAELFGYPYPYGKYDQIIVPDFNAGAMENAAAITFNDQRYVFRSKVTTETRRRRADTILHEMAHQWFGDLVTMRWWNGLWLNESFATFMAAGAVDQATQFKNSWNAFERMKQRAYYEDQLVTTHPIEVPVSDTDVAGSNFDGITYAKGASSLQQLRAYAGEDEFKDGVQRYFQKYALRNTTTAEFIKMISEASDQDLSKWQKLWLMTPGLNTVSVDLSCKLDEQGKSRIEKLNLVQGSTEMNSELRPHHAEVALFKMKNGKFQPEEIFPITYSQASTEIKAATGKICPDFIFPNYKDLDYTSVQLDEKSLEFASQQMNSISEPLLRQMVWHTLWHMVRDGKLKATTYADISLKHLLRETDPDIFREVVNTWVPNRYEDLPVLKILAADVKNGYQNQMEAFLRHKFLSAPAGSDLQLNAFDVLTRISHENETMTLMRALLTGKRQVPGFKVDQERRWDLIGALSQNGAGDAQSLIQAELKSDATDTGLKQAAAVSAAAPDLDSKKKWFAKILRAPGEEILPIGTLRYAMKAFSQLNQEQQSEAFVDAYFNQIPKLTQVFQDDEAYALGFAQDMFPSLTICNPAIAERTGAVIAAHSELPASILKVLRIEKQETERCVKLRTLTTASSN